MKHRMTATALAAAMTISGCVSYSGADYRPIVDTRDRVAYEQDLAECRELAIREVRGSDSRAARLGFLSTLTGALIGLAIGADVGDTGVAVAGAAIGAGIGAATSADKRRQEVDYRRADVIYQCMEGRGWRVLG